MFFFGFLHRSDLIVALLLLFSSPEDLITTSTASRKWKKRCEFWLPDCLLSPLDWFMDLWSRLREIVLKPKITVQRATKLNYIRDGNWETLIFLFSAGEEGGKDLFYDFLPQKRKRGRKLEGDVWNRKSHRLSHFATVSLSRMHAWLQWF